MARPRNEEAEAEIRACAYSMLLHEGYAATSYGAIADATGYSRAFVQHYLPKKVEMMGACLSDLLARIDAAVDELRPGEEPLVAMFLTGQAYFSLLCDARLRSFALDLLESRSLTEAALKANEDYPLGNRGAVGFLSGGSDEVVRTMGGTYEVLYRHLEHGGAFDPAAESLRIVLSYATSMAADTAGLLEACEEAAFDQDEYEALISMLVP